MPKSLALFVLLALLLPLLVACEEERAIPPPVTHPPVPPPAGLLAEMVVPKPGALLADIREATGSSALLVPKTLGGLVVNFFGLPIRMAEHVEEEKPVAVAVGMRKRDIDVAAAARLRQGDRFVEQATRGEDGSFVAQKDNELTWLEAGPKARRARASAALAVVDDYLVVGTSREAISSLGLYLARTVGPRTAEHATMDVRAGALAKLFEAVRLPALPDAWRPVVDPEEVLVAARAVARELGAGVITFELGKDALVLDARFEAANSASAKRLAAWPTMPARELLDVPDDTVAAAIWSEQIEPRHERARQRAEALSKWLGDAKEPLQKALESLSRGRGPDTRIGLRCTGVGLTGFATGSVVDQKALETGLKTTLTLADHASVKKLLAEKNLELESKKTRIERVPLDVWRLRLSPADKQGEVIDLLGGTEERRFFVAAGMETIDTLQRLHENEAHPHEAMRGAARRLGDKLWFGLLGDPQGLHACLQGKPGGSFATPVAVGAVPDGKKARLRLEVARPLLRLVSAL